MAAQFPGAIYQPAHTSNYRKGRVLAVDTILIHVTQSDRAGSAVNWFAKDRRPGPPSSAHYTVDVDGTIYQSVLEQDTAYGAPNFNARGIHIEHAGWVGKTKFPQAQYQASAELVSHLCEKHGIAKDRTGIRGHSELPGNDHTDPGALWNWKAYMALVTGAPVVSTIWQHPDGITVEGTVAYGVKWPQGTVRTLVLADDRFVVWNGEPESKLKILMTKPGQRKLLALAYGSDGKELGRDELYLTVKA